MIPVFKEVRIVLCESDVAISKMGVENRELENTIWFLVSSKFFK